MHPLHCVAPRWCQHEENRDVASHFSNQPKNYLLRGYVGSDHLVPWTPTSLPSIVQKKISSKKGRVLVAHKNWQKKKDRLGSTSKKKVDGHSCFLLFSPHSFLLVFPSIKIGNIKHNDKFGKIRKTGMVTVFICETQWIPIRLLFFYFFWIFCRFSRFRFFFHECDGFIFKKLHSISVSAPASNLIDPSLLPPKVCKQNLAV